MLHQGYYREKLHPYQLWELKGELFSPLSAGPLHLFVSSALSLILLRQMLNIYFFNLMDWSVLTCTKGKGVKRLKRKTALYQMQSGLQEINT